MPFTSNKGYTTPTTGSEVDTWGDELNQFLQGILDLNLGGIVSKTLGSSNVTLSSTESQNLVVRLTGTLTGNVTITTSCIGMTIVENFSTVTFSVLFSNGLGTAPIIPQSTRSVVITDGTNGARVAADNQVEFASGTNLFFPQASAPTGWTKVTSANNAAIRLVNGSSGGTGGGSLGFTSAFTSRSLSGSVQNTTLTIDQIPAHTHSIAFSMSSGAESGGGRVPVVATPTTTGSAGGGQSHNHGLSMNNLDLTVLYIDTIWCTKA